jgi:cell division transport system permease protein
VIAPLLRRRALLAPPSRAGLLLAFVAGAMCFLATLALSAHGAADRIAASWASSLGSAATVRIPAPEGRDAAGQRVAAALAVLEAVGLTDARVLSEAETAALAAPWLGPGVSPSALPLPVLIAVTPGAEPPDAAAVRAALADATPGAVYDDHGRWRAQLGRMAGSLADIALASAALALATLAAMVAAATRAALAGAEATTRTLRLLGARDGRIASAFDRPLALRALLGGAAGAAAASLTTLIMPGAALMEGLGVAASPAAGPELWAALAAPILAGLLAYATARATTLLMLRRAP